MSGSSVLLYCVCLVVWVYVLTLFKRNKLTAFHFMTGSVGFFAFSFLALKGILTKACSLFLMLAMSGLSYIFRFYKVYIDYYIMFIDCPKGSISMLIDYECCGIIEILVVVSIVLFFPAFTTKQKALYSVIGVLYTLLANIIRLLVVGGVIYLNGSDSYYISHAIVGRIVFYVLILFFYFYLLSYNQIKNQKVGNFEYGDK